MADNHRRRVLGAAFDRRTFIKTSGASVGAAVLAGCTSGDGGGGDTIHFGGALPLTGPLAQAGQWVRRGWQLWIDETNEDGGLLGNNVELTTYDHELNSNTMRSVTSSLVEDDNVDILLGTYPTTAVSVVSTVARRNNMPIVHIFEPNSMIEDRMEDASAHPTSFGLVNANKTYPQTFLEFAAGLPAADRPERVAILGQNSLLGEENSRFVREGCEEHGFEVVADELYDPESGDLSPVVRGIEDTNPDVIMGGSYPGDTTLLARAIEEVGIDVDFVWMMVGPQEPAVIDSLGAAGEGLYGTTMWVHSLPGDETQRLVETARERWDATPPYQFGAGYAVIQTFQQAIESADGTENEAVLEELESGSFDTVAGSFEFNEYHVSTISHALTQAQDGAIEVVWPDDLSTAEYRMN